MYDLSYFDACCFFFESTWKQLTSYGFDRKKISNAIKVFNTPHEVIESLEQEKAAGNVVSL